jgi:very-short-patch-repair endonuclease
MRTLGDTADQRAAAIAARQHGVVSRRQLVDAGFAARSIAHRVEKGRLIRLHRGVYAVGHRPPSPHARAMAAVLACGPGTVLSHRSAAALWDLIRWDRPIEVTARNARRHQGILVHRSRTLTRADVTRHYGIPVTTPARTLEDLARLLDPASLTRAVNDARIRNLVSRDHAGAGPTRSVFEDAFLAFVDRHALPRPEVNQRVAGHEVDMLWRPQRLVAELDGRAYHEETFEEDRDRDATLTAAGLRVVRVTWRRLTRQEEREAARFRALLA